MNRLALFLMAAASAYFNYQLNDSIILSVLAFIFFPVYLFYWLFVHGLGGGVIAGWFSK